MINNLTEISKDILLNEVGKLKYEGYRFVTATCVDIGDGTLDVIYHFDKDRELKNLRINLKQEEEVQSITKIYFCALLVENEMKELFGLKVIDIVIDFGGHMLLKDEDLRNPMLKPQIVVEQKGEGK